MPERSFVHLHCHSHYSLLDGASRVPELVARAKELGMNALALTDPDNNTSAFSACVAVADASGAAPGRLMRPPIQPADVLAPARAAPRVLHAIPSFESLRSALDWESRDRFFATHSPVARARFGALQREKGRSSEGIVFAGDA